jgi:hypothetical protein
MHKPIFNRSKEGAYAIWLLIEIVVYAIFVFAYYFLVLHFLGNWLKGLFDHHRAAYAVVALALMIAQGALLELLTAWLFARVRPKGK